jgi:hypothetical protein
MCLQSFSKYKWVKKENGELRRGKNKLKEKQFHIERHIGVLFKERKHCIHG